MKPWDCLLSSHANEKETEVEKAGCALCSLIYMENPGLQSDRPGVFEQLKSPQGAHASFCTGIHRPSCPRPAHLKSPTVRTLPLQLRAEVL